MCDKEIISMTDVYTCMQHVRACARSHSTAAMICRYACICDNIFTCIFWQTPVLVNGKRVWLHDEETGRKCDMRWIRVDTSETLAEVS